MSPPAVKICGVRTPAIAEAALDAGAARVGLVFVEASPRFVTRDEAQRVAQVVHRRGAQLVGVFRDEPPSLIRDLHAQLRFDAVQLHGRPSPDEIASLAPLRVVRALPFEPEGFADMLRAWNDCAQRVDHLIALLIDTPDPTKLGGGTGRTFDWPALRHALDDAVIDLPIILAGGLTPSNVAEAIRIVRPHAVDVSSGVESSRGVKDAALIRAFCEAALTPPHLGEGDRGQGRA